MLRVGLTGGIACGKTQVLRRFAVAGLATLDLDAVAHDEQERAYLRLLEAGLSKTDAAREAGLERSAVQALERRARRNIRIR